MPTKKTWAAIALVLAATPAAGQSRGNADPIVVPLRVHAGQFLVPVRAPDGTEFEFLLSTGNTTTVLSRSAAARLGGQTALMMGTVSVPMEGKATISDAELTVEGEVNDGIIGSNTLNRYDVLIDAPGGRLVLKPVGRSVSWEGMTLSEPVKLRVFHGLVLGLDVALEGVTFGAMLDVGTRTLVINQAGATKAKVAAEDAVTLRVGNTTLSGLPVRVIDLPLFHQADPDGAGFVLVGAPLARDCAISLSWLHQEMRTCVR